MTEYAIENDFRLGNLLVELDLVSRKRVEQAAVLSSLTTLPLGKLLSLLEYLPERLVKSSVEAQSMLRDRLIQMDLARKAIALVKSTGISFADALISLGFEKTGTRRSRLGELLSDAQKIEDTQLEFGLRISDTSGLPLGQVFILMNKITDDFLRMALALQREVRSGNIDRDRVIARLAKDSDSDQTSNTLPSADLDGVKIGEIFLAAGMCNQKALDAACLEAQKKGVLLGEFLIENNLVSPAVLSLALRLQSLVWQNRIDRVKAGEILKDASAHLITDDLNGADQRGLTDIDETEVNLFSFLRLSGYLSEDLLKNTIIKLESTPRLNAAVMKYAGIGSGTGTCSSRDAIKLALKDTNALRFILNEINPKDKNIVDSSLVLHRLVQDGKMSLREALFNFSIKRSGISNLDSMPPV